MNVQKLLKGRIDFWVAGDTTGRQIALESGVKNLKEFFVLKEISIYIAANKESEGHYLDSLKKSAKSLLKNRQLVDFSPKVKRTGVKVSDFTAGDGFLALLIKFDVNGSEKLTGISHQWKKKKTDGTFELATEDEIKLMVKNDSSYISLKVDGSDSGKSLGIKIGSEPEGSMTFADDKFNAEGGTDAAEVKAGIDWSRVVENPGISYDDKLGMRFFFNVNG